jgi:hypothetical protein
MYENVAKHSVVVLSILFIELYSPSVKYTGHRGNSL